MTENETFNVLKRTPFDTLWKMLFEGCPFERSIEMNKKMGRDDLKIMIIYIFTRKKPLGLVARARSVIKENGWKIKDFVATVEQKIDKSFDAEQ